MVPPSTLGASWLPLRLLTLLWLLVLVPASAADIRVYHSVDDVVAIVEGVTTVHAVLVLSTAQEPQEVAGKIHDDEDVRALVEKKYPHLGKTLAGLEGMVEFGIADIPDAMAITKKWNIAAVPALIIYKDQPKANPYTNRVYREALVANPAVLEQPSKLKKALKDSIPGTYVTELSPEKAFKTQEDIEAFLGNEKTSVVLVSKQRAPPPLYRALSIEFHARGLMFAFLNHEHPVARPLAEKWSLENLPAMVVITPSGDVQVLKGDKMKTFNDLRAFVAPHAITTDNSTKDAARGNEKTKSFGRLTAADFDEQVFASKLVWIVSFMDAQAEAAVDQKAWRKAMHDLQKKSGIVALGAVSCREEKDLCDKYGGPGVRVFPVVASPKFEIQRSDVLPDVYASIEEAKEPAIGSIPDVVHVMGSSIELNAFVSRSIAAKALPVILITKKRETPPMIKSLALSFPSHNVAFGVVSDADPQVKHQFNLDSSATTSLLCLISVEKQPDQPANAAPFGVLVYDKKTMGAYSYPNLLRFMMGVLSQYPHPLDEEDSARDADNLDNVPEEVSLTYIHKANREHSCRGNDICVIGFFEGHVDDLEDPQSKLSIHVGTLKNVAERSMKNLQPFKFMWTSGKCQQSYAEAFGVGSFQMPTVVVYSPSKQRYAVNVGLFDEENASAFLGGVLNGKIPTVPIDTIPELRDECTVDEVHDRMTGAVPPDDDDDLGDLLSEIIGDEEKQRRKLADELRAETKSERKVKKPKRKKKKAKKGNNRDEL